MLRRAAGGGAHPAGPRSAPGSPRRAPAAVLLSPLLLVAIVALAPGARAEGGKEPRPGGGRRVAAVPAGPSG